MYLGTYRLSSKWLLSLAADHTNISNSNMLAYGSVMQILSRKIFNGAVR